MLMPSPVPTRDTRRGESMWDVTVSAEMLHALRANPGVEFQLCDDQRHPVVMTRARAAALSKSCPRPYRVQTREDGDSTGRRIVWVSMDPAHWETVGAQ